MPPVGVPVFFSVVSNADSFIFMMGVNSIYGTADSQPDLTASTHGAEGMSTGFSAIPGR